MYNIGDKVKVQFYYNLNGGQYFGKSGFGEILDIIKDERADCYLIEYSFDGDNFNITTFREKEILGYDNQRNS